MKIIITINDLLINTFGLPKRNETRPVPLDMVIATVLSQNTNDHNSFKAFKNLKNHFRSWNDAADSDIETIEELIKVAGLKKQKSQTIKSILSKLAADKDYLSPGSLKNLSNEKIFSLFSNIKGIGIKTISCLLLFSLDRNICPVDTHVHRTLNRIGLVKTSSPDKTFYLINVNLPEGIAHSFHTNLIRLGREICKPQKPMCYVCPVIRICKYENKSNEENQTIRKRDFMLLDNV